MSQTAGDPLTEITKAARRWKTGEGRADPTRDGHEWVCNACPRRTPHLSMARDHVLEVTTPFPHIMFERDRQDVERKKPVRRRLLLEGARVIVQVRAARG